MFMLSAFSLAIVVVSCIAGMCAPRHIFDDNPFQRIGMAGIGIFCAERFVLLMEHGELVGRYLPIPAQIAGHVGLALYCAGTAYKVWKHNARKPQKPPLPPISDKHLHGVIGGSK